MWKSNGCTLTPTVAARARRRRRKKTRQSSVVSPAANPPRERTASRPNRLARAHTRKIKRKNKPNPHPSRPRINPRASSSRASRRTRTQILLLKLPSQVTLHEGCLPCVHRAERVSVSLSHARLSSHHRPSSSFHTRARTSPARRSTSTHRTIPREVSPSPPNVRTPCVLIRRLVASSRTRPAITDEDELKRRDLSLRRRGHGRSVRETRIARARLCRSRDERAEMRVARRGPGWTSWSTRRTQ